MVSTYPDALAWQRDRTRFNHDWLMVSFLTFLQAWRDDLDAAGRGSSLAPEAEQHLQNWARHRVRLLNLLADAEWALGPAGQQQREVSAGAPPTAQDSQLRQAHAVWCERSGIRVRLHDLNGVVSAADALVQQLLLRQPAQEAGVTLYSLCLQISRGLTALPSAGYL